MLMTEFKNEALVDFTGAANAEKMKKALTYVQERFGEKQPLVISGERVFTGDTIKSFNPANHSQIIGFSSKATQKHAEASMEAAFSAFMEWQKTSARGTGKLFTQSSYYYEKK